MREGASRSERLRRSQAGSLFGKSERVVAPTKGSFYFCRTNDRVARVFARSSLSLLPKLRKSAIRKEYCEKCVLTSTIKVLPCRKQLSLFFQRVPKLGRTMLQSKSSRRARGLSLTFCSSNRRDAIAVWRHVIQFLQNEVARR